MIHEMDIRCSFLSGLALLAAGAGMPLWSQETVWRIGTFDHASAEFAGRVGDQPVVVDAGAPDAARRWPASQAGTLNTHSGPQSHTRTVRFRMEAAAGGVSNAFHQAHNLLDALPRAQGEKKIEIVNRLHKEAVNDKEAIYFAFPFAAAQPEFEYEGQNGTVNPARAELAGGCREWYAAGHWARVSGGGISAAVIPVDAPLVTFGDINRGLWPEQFAPKSSTIFSYALNNYWHTNFPRVQSGEFTFRYVITSGARLDPAYLSRLGRESLTPLEIGELNRNDKAGLRGSLPATPASFLGLNDEGVEVETLKAAEDGEGTIVRLLETAGRNVKARLSSRLLEFGRGWLCNATEDKLREIPTSKDMMEVDMPPYGIVTLRLLMGRAAP